MGGVRRYLFRQMWVASAAALGALVLASVTGVAAYAVTDNARAASEAERTERAVTRPPPAPVPDATALGFLQSSPFSALPQPTIEPPSAVVVQSLEAEQQATTAYPVAEEPMPEPTAEPTPAPAPAAPAAPPSLLARVVSPPRADLYAIIAAAFPEDPETAYRVVLCESSGHPGINTGNGYYGMWQFDLATWQAVGGAGLPSDASAEEQTARARMLYDARGWQPWGCRPTALAG
jgi:hypothetical protein